MATCLSCGRELPAFTWGKSTPFCRECQSRQAAQAGPSAISATPAASTAFGARISVTTILVGINIAVFAAMLLGGASLLEPTTQQLLKWGANWGPLSLGTQPWRMLTSNYVHIGIIHILLNMWCLLNLGRLAQRIFDAWTYVLLYTCCGLAGSLTSLWWHPMVVGAGASGAIFGLAGALIAVLYLGHLPVPRQAVRGTLQSLLMFAGYNLLFGLKAGVDNSAHVGGLVAGLTLGAVLSPKIAATPEVRESWSRSALAGMGVILLVATIGLRYESGYHDVGPIQYSDIDAGPNGYKQLREKHYAEAIPLLQRFARLNPKSADAHYLLGLAFAGAQRPDEAIASFQRALQLEPTYADAQTGLGMAYADKGMAKEAADAYKKAAELKGDGTSH